MSRHRIYFHITWSTLGRRPMIDALTGEFLNTFLRRTAASQEAEIVELALLRTHVHVLLRTPPRFDLERLVHRMKGGSSYAANRLPGNVTGLRWNRRYAVSSVSPRSLTLVSAYLRNQATRHPDEVVGPS
jgi:REP element-mobilizing transposase RayT